MAKAWWLLTMLACACSSGSDKSPSPPAAWLSITLSEPTGEPQCFAAAPTPYDFGSEAKPLVGQETCTVHSGQDDSWVRGYLADSQTNAGGNNVVFSISTEQGLSLALASDLTRTLQLDPNAAGNCAPTFTTIIGSAATVEFDCPLLIDPADPTNGCGVRGTVTFENCATE
jgi:hypothetical protein